LTRARQNTKPIQLLTCEIILHSGVCPLYNRAFLLSNKPQSRGYLFVVKFNIFSFRGQNVSICHCELDFFSFDLLAVWLQQASGIGLRACPESIEGWGWCAADVAISTPQWHTEALIPEACYLSTSFCLSWRLRKPLPGGRASSILPVFRHPQCWHSQFGPEVLFG